MEALEACYKCHHALGTLDPWRRPQLKYDEILWFSRYFTSEHWRISAVVSIIESKFQWMEIWLLRMDNIIISCDFIWFHKGAWLLPSRGDASRPRTKKGCCSSTFHRTRSDRLWGFALSQHSSRSSQKTYQQRNRGSTWSFERFY